MNTLGRAMLKLSIVVPAFNEEENIVPLINEIAARKVGWTFPLGEVILVDDNSVDGTGKIAEELCEKYDFLRVIHRKQGNNGMGYALKAGTEAAVGDLVIWVMADRSDNLETISGIVDKIEQGYDLVFASRYMRGGSRGDLHPLKAFLSSSYTRVARCVFGMKVHDITNAFRGFRKGVFEKLHIESSDFTISPEFAIKAHMAGFRLGEVPTTYRNRRAGETKFKIIKMMYRYTKLLRPVLCRPRQRRF